MGLPLSFAAFSYFLFIHLPKCRREVSKQSKTYRPHLSTASSNGRIWQRIYYQEYRSYYAGENYRGYSVPRCSNLLVFRDCYSFVFRMLVLHMSWYSLVLYVSDETTMLTQYLNSFILFHNRTRRFSWRKVPNHTGSPSRSHHELCW